MKSRKTEQNVDFSTATILLQNYLNNPHWLRMIGVSEQDSIKFIVVYVSRITPTIQNKIPTLWYGFQVKVKQMSKPKVATKI